jgi:hypothetical protein
MAAPDEGLLRNRNIGHSVTNPHSLSGEWHLVFTSDHYTKTLDIFSDPSQGGADLKGNAAAKDFAKRQLKKPNPDEQEHYGGMPQRATTMVRKIECIWYQVAPFRRDIQLFLGKNLAQGQPPVRFANAQIPYPPFMQPGNPFCRLHKSQYSRRSIQFSPYQIQNVEIGIHQMCDVMF